MIRINYQPLIILVPLFGILWAARTMCARLRPGALERFNPWFGPVLRVTAICWLGGYVALVLGYCFSATHLDHIEPSIVSAAYTVVSGRPLYHVVESAERYSMLYGPTAYLGYGLAMRAFASDFEVCKVIAAVAGLGSLLFCWLAFRRAGSRRAALLFTGLLAGVFLAHSPKTFWVRADPIILLCVCGALCAAAVWSKGAAAVAFAFGLGIAMDAKVSAAAHFIPVAVILASRFGWRVVSLAGAGAVVIAASTFLLPGVSFDNWIQILRLAGRHGFRAAEVNWALQWAAMLLVAMAAMWLALRNEGRVRTRHASSNGELLVAVSLSVAVGAVFASKIGSDPTQLVPTVPVLCWAMCKRWQEDHGAVRGTTGTKPRWFGPFVAANLLTVIFLAAYQGYWTVNALVRQNPISVAIYADLRWLTKVWSGARISMGCGGNAAEFVSSHFPTLVLTGHPYVLDPAAVMEFEKAGIPLSAATVEMLQRGEIPVWLIPKGDAPFSMLNPYPPHRPLFDEEFRQTFLARYRKAGSSRFFDFYVFGQR